MADIMRTDTPWAFPPKHAEKALGSARDVDPIPLHEAANDLLRCVDNHRQRHIVDTYENLKIAIVDAV